MIYALLGVLVVQSVLLLLLTVLVLVASGFVALVAYRQWAKETGGFKAFDEDVMKLFKRVKNPDGSWSLRPLDEIEEEEDTETDEEWEDDYADGVPMRTTR